MKRLLLLMAACAALLYAAASRPAVFADVDQILAGLSRITGLKIHKKVPSAMITRDEVNQYLKQRVKEEVKPQELRAEELALKKFGLVPPDYDLVKSTIDLLTEQAAAFYDFKKKQLFVADWASPAMQDVALVHELAHALADQNFNLERFIKAASKSDDGSLARVAVMEGQASWLMTEYMARKAGQSLANSPALVESMTRVVEAGSSEYPQFEKAPLYIRETLMFPYTAGALFQQAVFQKMGQAGFAELFRRPPVSTQQVLHPDKYFDKVTPSSPAEPQLPSSKGFSSVIDGSLGELDFSILLRQYEGKEKAAEVAPHLRGGAYRVWERKADKRAVLAFAAEWDSPETARKFLQLYQDVLRHKWKRFEPHGTGDHVEGAGDDGNFVLTLSGAVVTSLEGLP